ncbi:MAG TPA: carbohydrate kinase family protein, partial [Vicinamibacterales bacterium]|nr:carbohydrate kinase family protein [Vicinamibacterales bacterium]
QGRRGDQEDILKRTQVRGGGSSAAPRRSTDPPGPAQLICAGEAFEDLIFVGLERLPELGEEIKTDQFTSTIGGGAVITAVKAARLGMKTTLISGLSDGAVTRLKKERVTIINLRKAAELPAVTAALSTGVDRAFVTFNGVNAKLEARMPAALRAAVPPKLARAKRGERRRTVRTHIHLCFYPHDCGHWTNIAHQLRQRGITTSWDFGWNEPLSNDRGLIDLIDALDFVFVNEHEARLYTGEHTIEASLPHWRHRKAIAIIKIGEEGAVWVAPDRDIHVAAPKVRVIDTTGAGDSFNAGFLVAWMNGKSPEQCLRAGNKVGAASTRQAGGI